LIYFALDSGTTNTTVWLMQDDRIVCESRLAVGVRQTSIRGNRQLLETALRHAFHSLSKQAPSPPTCVLAAGMLTSRLGFWEVPHVPAPAGLSELSKNIQKKTFTRVSPLPFFLVPGVRVGRRPCGLSNVADADVIRGEETEIVGFQASAQTRGPRTPWVLLHVGSHSKAIAVDAQGRIVRSASTLSGEALHALRTYTILASGLRDLKSPKLKKRFFEKGIQSTERYGLTRSLFMTRLLEGNTRVGQPELYSFLLGSILASDLRAFRSFGLLAGRIKIVLTGQPNLQTAWKLMLRKSTNVKIVTPKMRARIFLAGLRRIVSASRAYRKFRS
jgi:2-dehydro-3-deoxygalactonokinase